MKTRFYLQMSLIFAMLITLENNAIAFGPSNFEIGISEGIYYLAKTTHKVNLRMGPGTDCDIIRLLPAGSDLFVDIEDCEGDFYYVTCIKTGEEGYIHKNYFKIVKEVSANSGSGIQGVSSGNNYSNPTIKVFNNSSRELTLRLDYESYIIQAGKTINLSLSYGSHKFRASSPGVIPAAGTKFFDKGYDYTWEFYIQTIRR